MKPLKKQALLAYFFGGYMKVKRPVEGGALRGERYEKL